MNNVDVEKLKGEMREGKKERSGLREQLEDLIEANTVLRKDVYSQIQEHLRKLADNKTQDGMRAALVLETMAFCFSASARLREDVLQKISSRQDCVLQFSKLYPEESALARWLLRDEHLSLDTDFHFGGHTLSLPRPIKTVVREWERLFPQPRADMVSAVVDCLQFGRELYSRCQEEAKRLGLADVGDSIANMGFLEQKPYSYDEPDSHLNIVLTNGGANGPGRVRYATLNKLCERLTDEKYTDLDTRYVFLLTYHSFTTPQELLKKLEERYDIPIPANLSPEEINYFKQTKLDRIQIRVCSVLKNWLDEHYSDFHEDPALKDQLGRLINKMLQTSASLMSRKLAAQLLALMRKRERQAERKVVMNRKYPKPLIRPEMTVEQFQFEDANALEIARQLTLMDFEKFKGIRPRECLNKGWSKKESNELAPNIVFMSDQFKKISGWVQTEILRYSTTTERAKMFKKFITIAKHCRELNNFNSLFAIYCALEADAIYRLKRTKEEIPSKYINRIKEFSNLFSTAKNYANLRRVLKEALTPCIPYLGIFLQDLTFIEDGNKDYLHGMINFDKRCKLAERIRWIKQYQQEAYQFLNIKAVREYLMKALVIRSPDELYKTSLRVEPREPVAP